MISRIDPRSANVNSSWLRVTQLPISGRSNCPATNGASSCSVMSRNTPNESSAPATWRSEPASTGVSTTPTMLDADAAQSAAGTVPQAIDVNAIDDCTVEGRKHTNISRSDEHTSELQ